MDRTWTGQVRPEAVAEHERFVAWLSSPEGQGFLARALLTGYRLQEADGRVTVTLSADEPPPIIRFLRNRRFWPEFWEFESADRSRALGADAPQRVVWTRHGAASGSDDA